jgi:hypothetical protein
MKKFPVAVSVLLPVLSLTPVSAETVLTFSAGTPTANVMPRSRERAPLLLPDLEYQFSIDAVCRDDLSPASLSLAVADTRRTFDAEQIVAGALDDIRLLVPAEQIAPVVIANFCVAEGDADQSITSATSLTVHAALSAQASLLCIGDTGRLMKYASANLDVMLVCESPGNESDGSADRQKLTEL